MTFGMKGLRLYGAQCHGDKLKLSRSSLNELKDVRLQWELRKSKEEVNNVFVVVFS